MLFSFYTSFGAGGGAEFAGWTEVVLTSVALPTFLPAFPGRQVTAHLRKVTDLPLFRPSSVWSPRSDPPTNLHLPGTTRLMEAQVQSDSLRNLYGPGETDRKPIL